MRNVDGFFFGILCCLLIWSPISMKFHIMFIYFNSSSLFHKWPETYAVVLLICASRVICIPIGSATMYGPSFCRMPNLRMRNAKSMSGKWRLWHAIPSYWINDSQSSSICVHLRHLKRRWNLPLVIILPSHDINQSYAWRHNYQQWLQ